MTATYAQTIRKIEETTTALRYFRTLSPHMKAPNAERIIERYLNLLSAKARQQWQGGR
jgi:hypothetical protein